MVDRRRTVLTLMASVSAIALLYVAIVMSSATTSALAFSPPRSLFESAALLERQPSAVTCVRTLDGTLHVIWQSATDTVVYRSIKDATLEPPATVSTEPVGTPVIAAAGSRLHVFCGPRDVGRRTFTLAHFTKVATAKQWVQVKEPDPTLGETVLGFDVATSGPSLLIASLISLDEPPSGLANDKALILRVAVLDSAATAVTTTELARYPYSTIAQLGPRFATDGSTIHLVCPMIGRHDTQSYTILCHYIGTDQGRSWAAARLLSSAAATDASRDTAFWGFVDIPVSTKHLGLSARGGNAIVAIGTGGGLYLERLPQSPPARAPRGLRNFPTLSLAVVGNWDDGILAWIDRQPGAASFGRVDDAGPAASRGDIHYVSLRELWASDPKGAIQIRPRIISTDECGARLAGATRSAELTLAWTTPAWPEGTTTACKPGIHAVVSR